MTYVKKCGFTQRLGFNMFNKKIKNGDNDQW